MNRIRIGDREVGEDTPSFIIAEGGINHQGEISYAKKLIDIAVEAGTDAIKFQKRTIERVLTREAMETPYDTYNSFGKTYAEHRRRLELSVGDYRELKDYADEKGIVFLASAWDEASSDFLEDLFVPAFKIASADLTNLPLLIHVAKKGKPVLLSTGMADMEEVERAFTAVREYNPAIVLMQCTSIYPSRFENINLRVLQVYREKFGCLVGYSGHALGIAIPPAAVALGARIIERHITIDRTMKGSDHAASLEPQGIRKLVRDIRAVEKAMGTGTKRVLEGEWPIRRKLGKSLVSTRGLEKGEKLAREDLTQKSPGTGLSPMKIDEVTGRRVKRAIPEDTVIREEDVDW